MPSSAVCFPDVKRIPCDVKPEISDTGVIMLKELLRRMRDSYWLSLLRLACARAGAERFSAILVWVICVVSTGFCAIIMPRIAGMLVALSYRAS